MDDLSITIELKELLTLVDSARRVPGIEKELASLSRRLDGLQKVYSEVLLRLSELFD